jgi:hypothetical protein
MTLRAVVLRAFSATVVLAGAWTVTGYAASVPVASKSLTAPKTCILTANPASSTAAIDSAVQQGSAATNFGTATSANVTSSNNANRRLYLKFDLTRCSPAVPSSAIVLVANLRLYASAIPSSCRTHDIFRVTATWAESTITWTNQPLGTTVNSPPQAQRTASMNIGSGTCTNATANAYVSGWTVTTDVQSFVAGTTTNFGWMIRDDVENSTLAAASTYSTKNLGTLAQSPQLVVTYSS